MAKQNIELIVNGDRYEVAVEPNRMLVDVLREDLGLTGTKIGCAQGDCGACTVIMDGVSISSCLTLAVEAHQRDLTTIEGLATSPQELHPIQESFVQHGAVQCGYCTPGMVMSAKHLLDNNPKPSEQEIRQGLSGNLCRCTGYNKIVEAIGAAAGKMASSAKEG
ncbi:MAG: (2Fe-2S)-binding protein [Desulfarculus sp.]|nr:(2Fe-2S)-binding protein [Pseudomonadota bacterium]MBV1715810.1 (2Fe-2S)-binding protein [Desulfarculus sp.]MBU4574967.1 (2Fe-2S)-binding protein [Pseudomonadota bacterium]MBU4597347.1 (2Fe-2S)-binding protein [Pseudomonadota bacterium]MBV1739165.1 (2Fe-2S)-binding protein [Desulfarculus sp.]